MGDVENKQFMDNEVKPMVLVTMPDMLSRLITLEERVDSILSELKKELAKLEKSVGNSAPGLPLVVTPDTDQAAKSPKKAAKSPKKATAGNRKKVKK